MKTINHIKVFFIIITVLVMWLSLSGCQSAKVKSNQSQAELNKKIESLQGSKNNQGLKVRPVSSATPTQKDEYQRGMNLLKANNYNGAAEVFKRILTNDPTSPLAPNAGYWLGESFYAQGRYEEALKAFTACLNNYPSSDKAPDALLKMAYSNNMLGRSQAAMNNLYELLNRFPGSEAAKMVKSGRIKFRQPTI